jgi:hypothetical protein
MLKIKVSAAFIRTGSFFKNPTGQRLISEHLNPLLNNHKIQSGHCKPYQDTADNPNFFITTQRVGE